MSEAISCSVGGVAYDRIVASITGDGAMAGLAPEAIVDDGLPDLAGIRVLICEDEPMIGYDIAMTVEEAGGSPIGPFASVADALHALADGMPDGAILDVNLIDGDVTPVLVKLFEGGVPLVVNTGTRIPEELESMDVRVFIKPTKPEVLIRCIA